MTMQTIPASSLIVIQTTFLFRLLVELLNRPASANQWDQLFKALRGGQIAKVVFALSLLARQWPFSDEPSLSPCVDTPILQGACGSAHCEVAYERRQTACASDHGFLHAR